MKFVMEMDVQEVELKRCIISAMKKQYGSAIEDNITEDQIKPFDIGSVLLTSDVSSMLSGSCLGELLREQEIIMIRIE